MHKLDAVKSAQLQHYNSRDKTNPNVTVQKRKDDEKKEASFLKDQYEQNVDRRKIVGTVAEF